LQLPKQYTALGSAGKNALDYVTRRFNASSTGIKSRLGGLTFAEAPLSAISSFNWSPKSAETKPLFIVEIFRVLAKSIHPAECIAVHEPSPGGRIDGGASFGQ